MAIHLSCWDYCSYVLKLASCNWCWWNQILEMLKNSTLLGNPGFTIMLKRRAVIKDCNITILGVIIHAILTFWIGHIRRNRLNNEEIVANPFWQLVKWKNFTKIIHNIAALELLSPLFSGIAQRIWGGKSNLSEYTWMIYLTRILQQNSRAKWGLNICTPAAPCKELDQFCGVYGILEVINGQK